MPPSKTPETFCVPEIDTLPRDVGHVVVGPPVPPLDVGVGLPVGPVVVGVGFEPPPAAYVSNSAIRGALDALVISKVSFFSEVEEKEMVLGLPLPLVRTDWLSPLSTRHALIDPPPDACRMTALLTVVALLHLTE